MSFGKNFDLLAIGCWNFYSNTCIILTLKCVTFVTLVTLRRCAPR